MSRRRTRPDREFIAARRLRSVLRTHGVATDRILEQKISDAGPFDQRIDPHVLTDVRKTLEDGGEIIRTPDANDVPWFHLSTTADDVVRQRLDVLRPIYARTHHGRFSQRVGQALEIAIFRALQALSAGDQGVQFIGTFTDLAEHDDSTLYQKIEPLAISGRQARQGVVDFVVTTSSGPAAIEAKNVRQWLYPNRPEIRDLLRKSLDLDTVPVLIARRLPFVTVHVLHPCGVLVHQTYNQLYPTADAELADLAKDKHLLGYHDIRVGNHPDARLSRFHHRPPGITSAGGPRALRSISRPFGRLHRRQVQLRVLLGSSAPPQPGRTGGRRAGTRRPG